MKKIFFFLFLLTLSLSCQEEKIHEVIVIGGGLMGSSTAWHLSNYGESVLLIEKQGVEYNSGSSQGEARIARSNNRNNDIWSFLHNRSVKEVEELIRYLNSTASDDYKIESIYTTSPVTYVGRVKILDKLQASLVRQKVTSRIATNPVEGKKEFDVNLPDSVLMQREYMEHSGTINPRQLIQYLHEAVRLKGNTVWYNEEVNGISKKGNFYTVEITNTKTGKKKTLKTRKLVSAAGPYTGQLLKIQAPYFEKLINPQRVYLAFLKIKKETYDQYTKNQKRKLAEFYPVINSSKGTRDGSFFAMIEYIDKDGVPVIKIGGHFQRSEIENLDEVWKKELSQEEIDWCHNGTMSYFKMLGLPLDSTDLYLDHSYSCVYSLTQTEVPYVTNIPDEHGKKNPDFVVLGGMSGVGGKGAMTYGLIGANLLLGKDESGPAYQEVKKALGFERLLNDIEKLEE